MENTIVAPPSLQVSRSRCKVRDRRVVTVNDADDSYHADVPKCLFYIQSYQNYTMTFYNVLYKSMLTFSARSSSRRRGLIHTEISRINATENSYELALKFPIDR